LGSVSGKLFRHPFICSYFPVFLGFGFVCFVKPIFVDLSLLTVYLLVCVFFCQFLFLVFYFLRFFSMRWPFALTLIVSVVSFLVWAT